MWDSDEFQEDSRGSSVEKWEIAGSGETLIAYLRGPGAAAGHVESIYRAVGLRKRPLATGESPQWTHSLEFPNEIRDRVSRALSFLSDKLLIPVAPPLRCLFALGFYKSPEPGVDPMRWPNAPAGDLVHRAKYRSDDAAFDSLVASLSAVIRAHPWYGKHGDLVVSVPGHAEGFRFGERLAESVADSVGRPLVKIVARSETRTEAKSASRAELDLSHEFSITEDVSGKVVILIDDVYMTGRTLKNAAAVLSDSGARAVLGLVAARTMKAS